MEILDKLTDKLRRHVWCIIAFAVLLMFWIIAFSVTGKADNIAAWLSIVLSIIVIGYMFFQAYEMRSLIAKGHDLMAEKAVSIEQTAGTLAERAEAIEKASRSMTGTFQASEKVAAASTTTSPSERFAFDASQCPVPQLLMIYSLAKSQEHRKPVDIWNISRGIFAYLSEREAASISRIDIGVAIFLGAYLGIAESLNCFLESNAIDTIESERETEEKIIEAKRVPHSIVHHIMEVVKSRINTEMSPLDKHLKKAVPFIDEYFEKG